MKRIVAVIGLALVICALTAASALACLVQEGVWAPNNDGNGQSGGQTPTREQKACVPDNRGTQEAADQSPAVEQPCGSFN
jgi:hypothetical protein